MKDISSELFDFCPKNSGCFFIANRLVICFDFCNNYTANIHQEKDNIIKIFPTMFVLSHDTFCGFILQSALALSFKQNHGLST